MQHIVLQLEGENNNLIERSELNFADIIRRLPEEKDKFPWLYGVDPYGITAFNLYQVPFIIKELEAFAAQCDDVRKSVLEAIIFMNKIEQHRYIKMIGD